MSANLENSAVATGLVEDQFSLQSQRNAMPKNVQNILQLSSFHMLARLCPKSFMVRFSSMWTRNFQMNKLDLEKAKFIGSWRDQENSRKNTYFCFTDYANAFDCVQFGSVAQSCLTLRFHESQHARPPCPSPTPKVYLNSCPSSRWCHPAISSSVVPFSSCP